MRKIVFLLFVLGFAMTACGGGGGDSSSEQTVAPEAPGNVAVSAGNGQVTITWDASAGATSYNLYWGLTSGVTKQTGTKIQGVTSPYVHAGLTNVTAYYYVVTAVNSNEQESAESAEIWAIPIFSPPPPPAE